MVVGTVLQISLYFLELNHLCLELNNTWKKLRWPSALFEKKKHFKYLITELDQYGYDIRWTTLSD